MKRKVFCTLRLTVLVLVAFAAHPAGAATTAPGPYSAMPSWDQQLPASTRFVVLSNWIDAVHPSGGAAVLDRETGLVWEQSPSTSTTNWTGFSFYCTYLATGGRLGWRLPTIQELASLVDPSVPLPGPTLPSGHPFSNVLSLVYWSASTNAEDTGRAFTVDFRNGFVFPSEKGLSHLAWCVRGGQGVDPQ